MREIMTKQKKETSMKRNNLIKKFFLYLILLIITAAMLIPFIWMLSASIKTDREVFQMTPFVLIPETPRWSCLLYTSTALLHTFGLSPLNR